jgi:hypothetical protein
MENEIVKFNFNQQEVDFEMTKKDLMVNATQMAKIFGKMVNHFMENESTKKFISACLNNRNSGYLNVKTEEDLIISRQKSGTWMHRVLALKFAAWLDPDFEVWVYSTIDEILFGYYRRMEESLKRIAVRTNKINALKEEIRSDDRFTQIEQLSRENDAERKTMRRENWNQLELFKSLDNKELEIIS